MQFACFLGRYVRSCCRNGMGGRLVRKAIAALLVIINSGLTASIVFAEEQKATPTTIRADVFVPPTKGAPKSRVGAGTRQGLSGTTDGLQFVLPEGGSLTSSPTPRIVWQLATPLDGKMRVVLVSLKSGKRIVDLRTGAFKKGNYFFDIGRTDHRLKLGEVYLISVQTSSVDPGTRSLEIRSYLEKVEFSETNASAAQNGLWIDALEPYLDVEGEETVRFLYMDQFQQLAASAGINLFSE